MHLRLLVCCCLLLSATPGGAQTRLELNPPTTPSAPVETLVQFDPVMLTVQQSDGNHFLVADGKPIKGFGHDERAAQDALRVIRELKVNQYGVLAKTQPPLEIWLVDGQAPRKNLSLSNFLPFDNASLKVEKAFGNWMLRDRRQMLFSFGDDREAADRVLAFCKKSGVNQLGFIGAGGVPVMTYLMCDRYQGVGEKSGEPNPLEVMQSVERLGLVLPEIGLVGPRVPIDPRKIELARDGTDWVVRHGNQVFGHFGRDEVTARRGYRLMQDFRVNEVVRLGKSGFPLYLNSGQPLARVPLGFTALSFKPAELQVQQVNEVWFVTHQQAPLIEAGETREDAELLRKVIQFYRIDRLLVAGNSLSGGIKILMRDR